VTTSETATYSVVQIASEPEDPDRYVPLRVLGLLGRSGDDVEADEREEHQRRTGEDAGDAERPGREPHVLQQRRHALGARGRPGPRRGDERVVVGRLDVEQAGDDDEEHDGDLDGHHHQVDP